jgi:two-component system phosphate regulon sensor histidine kinase PhoR
MTVGVAAGGGYLEKSLRAQLEHRIESGLVGLARTSKEAMELLPADAPPAEVQRLAMRLGASAQARITIVDARGKVLGDSQVLPGEVTALESHTDREEILRAFRGGVGVARRFSTTVKQEMVYAAVPYRHGGQEGVLRVSLPLRDVDVAVSQHRMVMLFAGVLALVFSVFMSVVSAHYATRTIRDLFSGARALVRIEPTHLAASPTGDEIGGLAGSINEMAKTFEGTVRTLAQERDRFGAVLEGMGEALVALDGESRVTLCNRAALTLLGWSEAPVGKTLVEAIQQPALHDLAQRARREGKSAQEVEVETRGGKHLLARAARLTGDDGEVVLVMRDVTELRRLEKVRRDFVANVSHELRTPVSTIRATAEALVGGALDDKEHAMRFTQALLRNAERLSRIIADLLDLSRIEAGEQKIEIQGIGVGTAVHRAVEIVEGEAIKRGLKITLDVEGDLAVLADEAALDHVMLNLLDNAVKYSSDGGQVTVWARRVDGQARIEIRDDGPGVPERHRKRIFERFYRVDKGRSRQVGGTGLGLAIVRHLMESMDGSVGFLPNDPQGSVFWLVLRLADRPSLTPEAITS